MNNVISLGVEHVSFANQADDEMYFPVSLQECDVLWNNRVGETKIADASNFRAVIREDTGVVLAYHSDNYNLVLNQDIFPQFETALRMSNVDMTDMYTKVELVDDGGGVVKHYHFPAHQVRINKQDTVDLRITVRNSYNGRWAFGTILGGFRILCSNGLTVGYKFMSDYGKHTKNLNIETSVGKVNGALDVWLEHEDLWNYWAGKRVSDWDISEMIDGMKYADSFKDELLNAWRRQCNNDGAQTIWQFFNALTAWSTHGKMRSTSQASVTQMNRDVRVREIINSSNFRRLAA